LRASTVVAISALIDVRASDVRGVRAGREEARSAVAASVREAKGAIRADGLRWAAAVGVEALVDIDASNTRVTDSVIGALVASEAANGVVAEGRHSARVDRRGALVNVNTSDATVVSLVALLARRAPDARNWRELKVAAGQRRARVRVASWESAVEGRGSAHVGRALRASAIERAWSVDADAADTALGHPHMVIVALVNISADLARSLVASHARAPSGGVASRASDRCASGMRVADVIDQIMCSQANVGIGCAESGWVARVAWWARDALEAADSVAAESADMGAEGRSCLPASTVVGCALININAVAVVASW